MSAAIPALPKIGRNELDALNEIAKHSLRRGRVAPFWWRKASMRKLSAHGYVARNVEHGTDATPAWCITDAGLFFCRSARENLNQPTQD